MFLKLGQREDKKLDFQPNTKTERDDMSATASAMLRDYAADRWPTLNHKGRMSRLAYKLQWTFRRVRSIYQNEDRARLRADELAAIQQLKAEEAAHEQRTLEARIASIEALLFGSDPDFHSEQVAAFRSQALGRSKVVD